MELGDGLKFFFSRCADAHDIKHFTYGNPGGRRQRITGDKESEDKMYKILAKSGGRFWEFGHHLSHAANAFFTSNFDRSLIVAVDGGGWESDTVGTTLAIYAGVDTKINELYIYPVGLNLGGLWHEMTKRVFGLSVGYPKGDQAGTVMAMATLGKPKYTDLIPDYRRIWEKLKLLANSSEQTRFDLAASLQEYTEATFKQAISKYMAGHENLCLSGGVSLNCVMLAKIKKWFPNIKNIFCDPVPYDAGVAIGSARYLWHHVLGNPRVKNNVKNMSPYMGRAYSKKDINGACKLFSDKINIKNTSDEDILDMLNKQKIIAVFGGGSETGRRALGNRSILANPKNEAMKTQINARVKHRQWFRPLAPSILEEKIAEWFEDPILSPYMSFALKFKTDKQNKVPAVVHYDSTARLQTVNKLLSPWCHGFLTKWESVSGVPILLNTSFNDNEPIVETPVNALECFLKTEIDYLYFFDCGLLVEKV